MPMNLANYPVDWRAISRRIRARAGDVCEQCGVPNGRFVERHPDGRWINWEELEQMNSSYAESLGWDDPGCRLVRIVLTVHHTCQDPSCADESHLVAYCQRCHNHADLPMRQRHAAETRRRRRTDAGQQTLGLLEG